jgi:hypothetical protein
MQGHLDSISDSKKNLTSQGYDVSLALTKKDDDHATGSLMGMFDALADRVKK